MESSSGRSDGPYDPGKACELLADAGYADGFDLTIESMFDFTRYDPIVTQAPGDIGIRVTVDSLMIDAYDTRVLAGEYAAVVINNFFVNTIDQFAKPGGVSRSSFS